MILTILFTLAGAVTFVAAFVMWRLADFAPAGLAVAGPVMLAAIVLFGIAQIVHVLSRTAKAAEALLAEFRAYNSAAELRHQDVKRIATAFDAMARKRAKPDGNYD